MNRRTNARTRRPSPSSRGRRPQASSSRSRRGGIDFVGPAAAFFAALSASYVFFSFQGWGRMNDAKTVQHSLSVRLNSARDAVDALEQESSGFLAWVSRREEMAASEPSTVQESGRYARADKSENKGV